MLDFSEDVSDILTDTQSDSGLWVDKYRPKNLADICLDPDLKSVFEAQVKAGDIQNATFVGPAGTGKTSLALALVNEIHGEPLFVSCAAGEGKVDTIAMKIIPFCQYSSPNRKVVILDELDSASANQASSFQKSLRNVVEAYPECRFIATANYSGNIIEAVHSRMPFITISFNVQDMMKRVMFILKSENVDLSSIGEGKLKPLLASLIKNSYPDIRSMLGKLQMACTDGITEGKLAALVSSDNVDRKYDAFYGRVVDVVRNSVNPSEMRARVNGLIVDATSDGGDEFGVLSSGYGFSKGLFDYALDNGLAVGVDSLISLTGQLNVVETCIDKEPQAFRMLLLLAKAMGKDWDGGRI